MTEFYTQLVGGRADVVQGKPRQEDVFTPPKPPGSAIITCNDGKQNSNVSMLLLPLSRDQIKSSKLGKTATSSNKIYQKLALLTSDVDAFVQSPSIATGNASVDFVGSVPIPVQNDTKSAGSSQTLYTKVAAISDPEGNQIVAVDYNDFEKELTPPYGMVTRNIVRLFEKL